MGLIDRRKARLQREIEAWHAKIAAWDPATYPEPKRALEEQGYSTREGRRRD